MDQLVFGPRRVNARRIVSVPRAVLMAISLQVPARVEFSIELGRVLLRARSSGGIGGVMVSRVGQVSLPGPIVQSLGIAAGGAVYARVFDETAIELLPATAVSVANEVAT